VLAYKRGLAIKLEGGIAWGKVATIAASDRACSAFSWRPAKQEEGD